MVNTKIQFLIESYKAKITQIKREMTLHAGFTSEGALLASDVRYYEDRIRRLTRALAHSQTPM